MRAVDLLSKEYLSFLAAGGASVVANISARVVLSAWLPYPISVAIAYVVGMVVAFLLMKRYVFTRSTKPLRAEVIGFCVVNALGLVQTVAVSYAALAYAFPMLGFVWQSELLAHGLSLATLAVTSFFLHRRFTFHVK